MESAVSTQDDRCVFCRISAGDEPAILLKRWRRVWAIQPLKPVTPGHVLVMPRAHVADYTVDPAVSAEVMHCAAEFANDLELVPSNVITSAGRDATQSVMHLHLHIIPRSAGDGLALPWSPS